jgi:ABC-type uncharacterized transport system fused permease/ATPase subunit
MQNATTASNIYALGINQVANLINTIGHNNTVLVQGNMGTGKSSILKILADLRPHTNLFT